METLKIAVQKSGRLSEKSLKLLSESGIKISNSDRKLRTSANNFPLEILFLRDDDIPQYVEQGIADIGILGENVVKEKQRDVSTRLKLGFASCRLSLAVAKNEAYTDISFFDGKRVATSYPKILQQYFSERKISVEIEEISGSVEIAPGIGLADGICDIVSTGSTLFSNGLKEVETVLKSEAILISGTQLGIEKEKILKKLLFRIQAVLNAANSKYILLNAKNESIEKIISILPGMRSPTVLPLAQTGWSSVHSVVPEDEFWEIIDQLKEEGAEGIIVIPIEKMIR